MKLLVGCMTMAAARFGPAGCIQAPYMRGRSSCRPDWLSMAAPGLTSMTANCRSGMRRLWPRPPAGPERDYDAPREVKYHGRAQRYRAESTRPLHMPNIAAVLKDEIARIARKELRAQTEDVRKTSAQNRSHIA